MNGRPVTWKPGRDKIAELLAAAELRRGQSPPGPLRRIGRQDRSPLKELRRGGQPGSPARPGGELNPAVLHGRRAKVDERGCRTGGGRCGARPLCTPPAAT